MKKYFSSTIGLITDFGTLEFTGVGYPKAVTSELIWDQMDLQRAT